nr:MAG TPA: hypothetical protein [Caudoviricetes sp.]
MANYVAYLFNKLNNARTSNCALASIGLPNNAFFFKVSSLLSSCINCLYILINYLLSIACKSFCLKPYFA